MRIHRTSQFIFVNTNSKFLKKLTFKVWLLWMRFKTAPLGTRIKWTPEAQEALKQHGIEVEKCPTSPEQ